MGNIETYRDFRERSDRSIFDRESVLPRLDYGEVLRLNDERLNWTVVKSSGREGRELNLAEVLLPDGVIFEVHLSPQNDIRFASISEMQETPYNPWLDVTAGYLRDKSVPFGWHHSLIVPRIDETVRTERTFGMIVSIGANDFHLESVYGDWTEVGGVLCDNYHAHGDNFDPLFMSLDYAKSISAVSIWKNK